MKKILTFLVAMLLIVKFSYSQVGTELIRTNPGGAFILTPSGNFYAPSVSGEDVIKARGGIQIGDSVANSLILSLIHI